MTDALNQPLRMALLVVGLIFLVGLEDPAERANMFGDVPALIPIGVVLMLLMRKAQAAGSSDG